MTGWMGCFRFGIKRNELERRFMVLRCYRGSLTIDIFPVLVLVSVDLFVRQAGSLPGACPGGDREGIIAQMFYFVKSHFAGQDKGGKIRDGGRSGRSYPRSHPPDVGD